MASEVESLIGLLLRYVYAVQVDAEFRKRLFEECNGCVVAHPSQRQHTCIDPEFSWGPDYRQFFYTEAEEAVNRAYLAALFVETVNLLKLGSSKLINIGAALKYILESWEREDFIQIERVLENAPQAYVMATSEVQVKLNKLESRFTR